MAASFEYDNDVSDESDTSDFEEHCDSDDSDSDEGFLEARDISIPTARVIAQQLVQRKRIGFLVRRLSKCRIAKEVLENSNLEDAVALYAKNKKFEDVVQPLCLRIFRITRGMKDPLNESFGVMKRHETPDERRNRLRRASLSSGYASDSTTKSEELEVVKPLSTVNEEKPSKLNMAEPIFEKKENLKEKLTKADKSPNSAKKNYKKPTKELEKSSTVSDKSKRSEKKRKTAADTEEPVSKKAKKDIPKKEKVEKKELVSRKDKAPQKKETKMDSVKNEKDVKKANSLKTEKKINGLKEQKQVVNAVFQEKQGETGSYRIPKKIRKEEIDLKHSEASVSTPTSTTRQQLIPTPSTVKQWFPTLVAPNPAEALKEKLMALPQIPHSYHVLPLLQEINHKILAEAERLIGREMGRVDRVWWEMYFRDFGKMNEKVSCGIRQFYTWKVNEMETHNRKKADAILAQNCQPFLLPPPPPPPF